MSRTAGPRTSERTARLGFSDIVKIRNQVLAMIAGGRDVIRLEGGEPYPPTPDFVKDAIKRALDENQTRYAPSSGIPPLIEAIRAKLAERNGIEAAASQIIVVNGGAHGLFCAFQATLDEGDEAVFFSPYWTPIRDLVSYAGGKPVLVPWEELETRTAAEAIEARITPRTRVLYLNSPSNPTGSVIPRADLERIAALAIRRDLVVVADEAYEDLFYEEPHASIAAFPGMMERTLTVYTLSKSYSMTGGRIGYVVAGEAFMDVLRKLVLNSTNGVSTPTQFGALAALADRSDYLQATRDEYRRRRDILVAGALEAGFRCSPPRGAFYLFADVRERLGADSWAAMQTLLDKTGIATVPGAVFGREGEGHLRMSFSNPIAVLERAVGALREL
ncbi:MAG TPA: aminotransferase class I/II-fold pyridoxal phosphate-dependent enzyme [Thermoanaerobaculia bacterium]|nr:aminotransferase class I/II-fold pyridoxal phosphate-dependent enzyme [Thermoanaerobaculia bacterium]